MPIPPSALSVAAQGVADAIVARFRANGSRLHVSLDTPVEGAKQADGNNVINLFFYRVAPSGFHAAQTANDPMMIRVFCLVTPFADRTVNGGGTSPTTGETDLRLLGEVLRLFHEHPVLGPLTAAGTDATAYTLQAVLQAPEMEEINHIWTALGGTEAYRPSAVYEFSLIPVDPAEVVLDAPPAYGFEAELDVHMRRRDSDVLPQSGLDAWSPGLQFVDAQDELTASLTLQWTPAEFAGNPANPVTVAAAGVVGEDAVLVWERLVSGAWTVVQTGPLITLATARIEDPTARSTPAMPAVTAPETLRLTAWPADGGGQPLAGARPSNTLALILEAAP